MGPEADSGRGSAMHDRKGVRTTKNLHLVELVLVEDS